MITADSMAYNSFNSFSATREEDEKNDILQLLPQVSRESLVDAFHRGIVHPDDIDRRSLDSLSRFCPTDVNMIVSEFLRRPEGLADIRNKSAYLAGIMSRVRKENDRNLSTLHPMSRTDTPLTRVTNSTTYNITDDQVFDRIALRVRAKVTELQTRSTDSVTFDRKSLLFLKSMPEKLAMIVLDDLSKMPSSHRSADTYATLSYLHNQLGPVYNSNYDKKENLASQINAKSGDEWPPLNPRTTTPTRTSFAKNESDSLWKSGSPIDQVTSGFSTPFYFNDSSDVDEQASRLLSSSLGSLNLNGDNMRLQNRPPPLTTSLFTEPFGQESRRTPLTTPVHLNGSTPHSQYSTGFGYSPIPIYHSSGSTDGRTYEQCSNDFLRRASPHSSLYSSPKNFDEDFSDQPGYLSTSNEDQTSCGDEYRPYNGGLPVIVTDVFKRLFRSELIEPGDFDEGAKQVLTDLALVSAHRAAQALSELEAKLKGEPSVVRNVSAYFTGIAKKHILEVREDSRSVHSSASPPSPSSSQNEWNGLSRSYSPPRKHGPLSNGSQDSTKGVGNLGTVDDLPSAVREHYDRYVSNGALLSDSLDGGALGILSRLDPMHGITALDQLMAVMSDRPIRNTSAYFVKICTKYVIGLVTKPEHKI